MGVAAPVGAGDIYDASENQAQAQAITLPTDGSEIFVTLKSLINGAFQSNNYVFTAADLRGEALVGSPPMARC